MWNRAGHKCVGDSAVAGSGSSFSAVGCAGDDEEEHSNTATTNAALAGIRMMGTKPAVSL
jgi:hypothetical protein